MKHDRYPTPWQKKILWFGLTTIAVVVIGSIAVGGIALAAAVLSFLQPVLIPFAVAGVLAYLLDPVVSKMLTWGIPRRYSVLAVFAVVSALLLWGFFVFVPLIQKQTGRLFHKLDDYTRGARIYATEFTKSVQQKWGFNPLPPLTDNAEEDSKQDSRKPAGTEAKASENKPVEQRSGEKASELSRGEFDGKNAINLEDLFDVQKILKGDWIKNSLNLLINNVTRVVTSSVGGFLNVFGFLLSIIIIPIYLYYFLIDARTISQSWQDYLPIRASKFKNEVVSTLTEINGYLIVFFRGQLLVSVINGTATALGLVIVGLDFGLLIGLVLCILGLVPYLGILLCWIPAVIISLVQGGAGTWVPTEPGWLFPAIVTGIFVLVQKIDSFFITPRVVASRIGLHPMTVIVSLFVWSLLIGGLLGTILAVPLTATLKVLLRRYVWERRILNAATADAASRDDD
ncbi:MAG: hypothetical protein RLZZ399_2001 [Verrucomicrobiota bacterium]|jgi:predicted PurR-regulated permease PerM